MLLDQNQITMGPCVDTDSRKRYECWVTFRAVSGGVSQHWEDGKLTKQVNYSLIAYIFLKELWFSLRKQPCLLILLQCWSWQFARQEPISIAGQGWGKLSGPGGKGSAKDQWKCQKAGKPGESSGMPRPRSIAGLKAGRDQV
jgi:hypothetical protein